jgi:hypothetical protein
MWRRSTSSSVAIAWSAGCTAAGAASPRFAA